MDASIDGDRLKALDGYILERLQRRQGDYRFHTGDLTVDVNDDQRPGSLEIPLTTNKKQGPYVYLELNQTEPWEPNENADEFSELMDFIRTLPFKRTGRMMTMYDSTGKPVTAHRDHAVIETCHEFIWFRPRLSKPLYMQHQRTGKREYVRSYGAWFDTVNQFHGADATPDLSISIRVDGTFSDELRAHIPVPPYNKASTASLWACIGDKN